MIVAFAIIRAPAIIPGDTGTFKFIVNISSPSTMLSLVTAIFTVLLLVPAMIIAFCVVELKSSFPPYIVKENKIVINYKSNYYFNTHKYYIFVIFTTSENNVIIDFTQKTDDIALYLG